MNNLFWGNFEVSHSSLFAGTAESDLVKKGTRRWATQFSHSWSALVDSAWSSTIFYEAITVKTLDHNQKIKNL